MSGPARNAARVNADVKSSKQDDPAQSKRFIEAARKAEADETREEADRAFKKVALPKKKAKI
jgi:hypothetical protein